MGDIISTINGLDQSGPALNEQKELIEVLSALAKSKAEAYALDIEKKIAEANSEFNKTLPVESFLSMTSETHAYSTDSVKGTIDKMTAGVKKFVQPDGVSEQDKATNIIDGVGSLLGTAVEAFLGGGSSSDDSLERMCVYLSGFGVERLDFRAWKRVITGSGIKTKIQGVSCFVGVRSAVDMSKVKLNTFLILYAKQLNAMGYDSTKMDGAIDAAKKMLQKFEMGTASNLVAPNMPRAMMLITGRASM